MSIIWMHTWPCSDIDVKDIQASHKYDRCYWYHEYRQPMNIDGLFQNLIKDLYSYFETILIRALLPVNKPYVNDKKY